MDKSGSSTKVPGCLVDGLFGAILSTEFTYHFPFDDEMFSHVVSL